MLSDRDARAAFERHRQRHGGPQPGSLREQYSSEELIFLAAVETYKRVNRRPFPAWTELLELIHTLGYTIPLDAASDAEIEQAADRARRRRRRRK